MKGIDKRYHWLRILAICVGLAQSLSKLNVGERCEHDTLVQEYVGFGKERYPRGSHAWNKMKNLLDGSLPFQVYVSTRLLGGSSTRLGSMLEHYGFQVTYLQLFEKKFFAQYRPGKDLVVEVITTLLPLNHGLGPARSLGWSAANFSEHKRILIQPEQTQGRRAGGLFGKHNSIYSLLGHCHDSEQCMIIDYSDFNYKSHRKRNLTGSVIVAPVLFGNSSLPFKSEHKSLNERFYDFGFFVTKTRRRADFLDGTLKKFAKAHQLKLCRGMGNKIKSRQRNGYDDTKVCMIPASERVTGPGEYLRTFQLLNHGCLILYERHYDLLGYEAQRTCGGIFFSSLQKMPQKGLDLLNMTSLDQHQTTASLLARQRRWWEQQHTSLNSFLTIMFL